MARGREHRLVATFVELADTLVADFDVVELFQVQNEEGPCQDCFTTGRPVGIADLEDARERWPRFAPKALSVGFRSVQAVPLRLRGDILGALNLFRNEPGGIGEDDQRVVQAMGDIATIGLLQQREANRAATVTDQLQHALHSRISIEQAKGVISAQSGRSIDDSFALLRQHSRRHNHKLSHLAHAVVQGAIDATSLSD